MFTQMIRGTNPARRHSGQKVDLYGRYLHGPGGHSARFPVNIVRGIPRSPPIRACVASGAKRRKVGSEALERRMTPFRLPLNPGRLVTCFGDYTIRIATARHYLIAAKDWHGNATRRAACRLSLDSRTRIAGQPSDLETSVFSKGGPRPPKSGSARLGCSSKARRYTRALAVCFNKFGQNAEFFGDREFSCHFAARIAFIPIR